MRRTADESSTSQVHVHPEQCLESHVVLYPADELRFTVLIAVFPWWSPIQVLAKHKQSCVMKRLVHLRVS